MKPSPGPDSPMHRIQLIARSSFVLVGLCFISLVILLSPIKPSPIYTSVQSLNALVSPHAFLLALSLWWVFLWAALWGNSDHRKLAIVVLAFGVVFFGFWNLRLPSGRFEDWTNMQSVRAILLEGRVGGAAHYWQWPGLGFVGSILEMTTGAEIRLLRSTVVLVFQMILVLLIFVFSRSILGDSRLAALSTVLAIVSNELLARFHYYPRNYAHVLFMVILVELCAVSRPDFARRYSLALSLAAITATHLVTASLAFLLLLVLSIVALPSTQRSLARDTAGVAWALLVSWHLYWAVAVVPRVALTIPQFLYGLVGDPLGTFYSYVFDVASVNLVRAPLWMSLSRAFWLTTVYLAGSAMVLMSISRWRRLDASSRLIGVAFVALLSLTLAGMILSPGGEQVERYLYFATPLLAPIIVQWVSRRRHFALRHVLLMFIPFVAVPSFLIHGNLAGTFSYYRQQVLAGEFLGRILGGHEAGQDLITAVGPGWSVAAYFARRSTVQAQAWPDETVGDRLEFTRRSYESIARRHSEGISPRGVSLLWSDLLATAYVTHWFGPVTGPAILEPIFVANERTAVIYDNGFVQISTDAQNVLLGSVASRQRDG